MPRKAFLGRRVGGQGLLRPVAQLREVAAKYQGIEMARLLTEKLPDPGLRRFQVTRLIVPESGPIDLVRIHV